MPGAVDYVREMKRLRQKIDAGADMIMTQPVYDAAVMRTFLDDVQQFPRPVPVLMGLCPLVSFRNAEFLHHEVPGMSVPQPIRDRMSEAGGGAAGIAEGVKIAKEMLDQFKAEVVGCYIMPQLGKYEAALGVLEDLGYGKDDSVARRDAPQIKVAFVVDHPARTPVRREGDRNLAVRSGEALSCPAQRRQTTAAHQVRKSGCRSLESLWMSLYWACDTRVARVS